MNPSPLAPEKRYSKRFKKIQKPHEWRQRARKENEKLNCHMEKLRIKSMMSSRGLSDYDIMQLEEMTDTEWWQIPGNKREEILKNADIFGNLEKMLYDLLENKERIEHTLKRLNHPRYK